MFLLQQHSKSRLSKPIILRAKYKTVSRLNRCTDQRLERDTSLCILQLTTALQVTAMGGCISGMGGKEC